MVFITGKKLEFRTLPFTDVFAFDLDLHVEDIRDGSVEVSWSGVPSPDQKFVNIYRKKQFENLKIVK